LPNALTVIAIAEKGSLLNAPDTYMDKIAIGAGFPEGVVDLDADPAANIIALAEAKGVSPSEITACVLDRPRHAAIIEGVRKAGGAVRLITDGDIAGVIATSDPATGIDIYLGQGGAPEGVLAAAALRCVGGQIQTRLVFRNDEERARAARLGITDLKRKYCLTDLAGGDVVFAATGVTDGAMLEGVHRHGPFVTTSSILMRSGTRTVRWIKARHLRGHAP
jgi:fructose-1,6-bisphosphatase II / sedoheptulose-1,7-bisphosphatase